MARVQQPQAECGVNHRRYIPQSILTLAPLPLTAHIIFLPTTPAAAGILTLEYTTQIYGTIFPISDTLQFRKESQQVLQKNLDTKTYQHDTGYDIGGTLGHGDVALAEIDAQHGNQESDNTDGGDNP